MLVPKNILKMTSVLKKDDLFSPNGIFIQRDGEKLHAYMTFRGIWMMKVSFPEIPMEDFPMIPGNNTSLEKTEKGVFISKEVCGKALKAMPKSARFPVIECLFVEETPQDDESHRCFLTDLENVSSFRSAQEVCEHVVNWMKEIDESYQSNETKITFNAQYMADICSLILEILPREKRDDAQAIHIETNVDRFHAFRITAEKANIEITVYLMPVLVD